MPALAQASSASPPGAPETPMAPTIEPPPSIDQPAADDDGARQITQAGLRHAGLADRRSARWCAVRKDAAVQALPVAVVGVCAPAKRSRSITWVDAEAIDHRDRDLVSALAAFGERGAGAVQRNLRTQRFVGDERILRA